MINEETAATASPLQAMWGDALRTGFVIIPSVLLRHQQTLGLESGEVMVLLNLFMSWRTVDELPYPHTSTIARRMGVSRRTVQRHIESLETKKLIQRLWHRGKEGERAGARYDLTGIVEELKRLRTVTTAPAPTAADLALITDGRASTLPERFEILF